MFKRKLLGNKILAIVLLFCGYITYKLSDDATALVWLSLIAVPVFCSRHRCTYRRNY